METGVERERQRRVVFSRVFSLFVPPFFLLLLFSLPFLFSFRFDYKIRFPQSLQKQEEKGEGPVAVVATLASPPQSEKSLFLVFFFASSPRSEMFFPLTLRKGFPGKKISDSSRPLETRFSGSSSYHSPHLSLCLSLSLSLLAASDRVEARNGRDGHDDRDEHDAAGNDRLDEVLERRRDLGLGRERGREHSSRGGGDAGGDLEGELLALGAVLSCVECESEEGKRVRSKLGSGGVRKKEKSIGFPPRGVSRLFGSLIPWRQTAPFCSSSSRASSLQAALWRALRLGGDRGRNQASKEAQSFAE